MKESEAQKLFNMLRCAFPGQRLTNETAEVYEQFMLDLDFEATKRAIASLIGTRVEGFIPTIGAIRKAVLDITSGPQRTGAEAWQEALEQVRAVGWCGKPTFADPLVAEALRLFGSWQEFCASPEDDAPGRARFIAHYEVLQTRARQQAQAPVFGWSPKANPERLS